MTNWHSHSQTIRWSRATAAERRENTRAAREAAAAKGHTLEQRRKNSDAKKLAWAEGHARPKAARICRGCDARFAPNSGPQRYCNEACKRNNQVAAKHGLRGSEYVAILEAQGGRCALCGGGKKGWSRGRHLQLDHCHRTGRIRGFLCGDCNTALGRFGDDPERLRAAIAYLEG
jgi:hypothetical protein